MTGSQANLSFEKQEFLFPYYEWFLLGATHPIHHSKLMHRHLLRLNWCFDLRTCTIFWFI